MQTINIWLGIDTNPLLIEGRTSKEVKVAPYNNARDLQKSWHIGCLRCIQSQGMQMETFSGREGGWKGEREGGRRETFTHWLIPLQFQLQDVVALSSDRRGWRRAQRRKPCTERGREKKKKEGRLMVLLPTQRTTWTNLGSHLSQEVLPIASSSWQKA